MICKKIDKIIVISFIFFLTVYILRIYFYTENSIIKILEITFLTVSLFGLIVLGIRKIDYKRIETWIRPFIGIVIILLLFFMNLSLENRLETLTLKSNEIEKIEKKLTDKNISSKEREKWSKIYAQYQYIQNGKIVEYLLEDNYILYKPTKEDIASNQRKVDIQKDKKNIGIMKYYWLLLLLISIFFGILTRFELFSFLSCKNN